MVLLGIREELTELVPTEDNDSRDDDLEVLLESEVLLCGVEEAIPLDPEGAGKPELPLDSTLEAALEAVLEPALGRGFRVELLVV